MPSNTASKPEATKALNERQLAFVREYLIDLNATQAAIRAGYSPKTAGVQGFDLLKQPQIAEAVASAKAARAVKLEITAEGVLTQIARMVFVDPRKFVDDEGSPIPLQRLSDESAAAIQGFEVAADGTYKVKFVDRNSAADKLMRHLGLFEKDNGQTGNAIGTLLAAVHGAGSRLPTK